MDSIIFLIYHKSFLNEIQVNQIFVIMFYICALLILMDKKKIKNNFWGKNEDVIDIIKHLKNVYIICIFCFLGIETSTTLSNKSKSEKLVSIAINVSYVIVTILYLLSSFLSYGILEKDELSKLRNPSMAFTKKIKRFWKIFY